MMLATVLGSPKKQFRNLLHLVAENPKAMGGRPKHLERRGIPPEVFHLLEALEKAAEAVGASLLEAAKVPGWRKELDAHVARLTSLLLVRGESGARSVMQRIADLEDRLARLEEGSPSARADRTGGAR